MPKCECCGKEVLLPFVCPYCRKIFCSEHRLPENHQCSNLPKKPLFWYQKGKVVEERFVTKKLGMCPRCGSVSTDIIDYDAKTMTFECKKCGHKWIQQKAFAHDVIESKEKPKHPKTKERVKNTLSSLLIGFALSLLGLGIIIWEIYNRLFWTIVLVWFIPIPLVLIGGFFVILGVIIAAGSVTTFVGSLSSIKKIVAILLIVTILGVVLWNAPSLFLAFQKIIGIEPSPTYSHEELVNYALSLINSDRRSYGLQNVSLSEVGSAQQHSDNMLKNHFFSHWDVYGYKPYMRYTLAGGQGSVAENVAWYPSNIPIDAKEAIKELERQMMYEDAEWDWGHKNNILDPFHNKVSIGIAYDNYNLYFVQDFENDYIEWSTSNIAQNGEVIMSGSFKGVELSVEWVNIFYDPLPSNLTSVQLERTPYNGSYTMGTFLGMVVPSGYESPEGITITAQTWIQSGTTFEMRFNLSPVFDTHGEGVYTLYLQPDPSTSQDSLTSFSFWYNE
jgi:uncharacterized protein YkwD